MEIRISFKSTTHEFCNTHGGVDDGKETIENSFASELNCFLRKQFFNQFAGDF